MKTKRNTLKLNATAFHNDSLKAGQYHKEYFFANGLGASVVCHEGSYGGSDGYFEIAIKQYPPEMDPSVADSKIIYDHPIAKRHHCVEVITWLDFHEVASILQEIRNYETGNYDTGDYNYDRR